MSEDNKDNKFIELDGDLKSEAGGREKSPAGPTEAAGPALEASPATGTGPAKEQRPPSGKARAAAESSSELSRPASQRAKGGRLKLLALFKFAWGTFSWIFWMVAGLAVFGLVMALGSYFYFSQDLPTTGSLQNYAPKTVTYFYSDDGRIIGEYCHERRLVVPLEKIPQDLINALVATEDAQFYSHPGINIRGIARAVKNNLAAGDRIEGASTITQQVVRAFLLTPERTYKRKIKEMILAYRIEQNLSKNQILFLYLNHVYFGDGAHGVEAAAQTFFGKPVNELNLPECALLAGLPQAPSRYSPIHNPQTARERQTHVLRRMAEVGYIDEEQAARARAEDLNFNFERSSPNTTVAPYFTEHVRRLMEERFGAESLYNDGWRIYTTVNIEHQRLADEAVARGLWEYARRRGFRGPIKTLAGDEAIRGFLKAQENQMSLAAPRPNHLYQAVVMEVMPKERALKMRLGPYEGLIEAKRLGWALKKKIDQQFKRGDVLWVRLLEPETEAKPGAAEPTLEELRRLARSTAAQPPARRPVLSLSLEGRTNLQAALISMDLANGDIKAMVGGRDFNESQFNRATQSRRQPGSSFKPIIYASALENGFTPGSVMIDSPFTITEARTGKIWAPMNADRTFKGPMDLYSALVASRNIISIKVLEQIGFKAFRETAAKLGITEEFPDSLALALGSHGVLMPEMVSAFSAFPNLGQRMEPRYLTRIEDRYGRVVETFEPVSKPSILPSTGCSITWMLRGAVAQGTGTAVRPLNRPVAGKTGTTNDYSDAWFVGFTPEYAAAVWLGTDQLRPRAVGEVGGKAAAPIFLYYMEKVLQDRPVVDFTVPPDAEIAAGGAFGICYRKGTIGTGFSERPASVSDEEHFIRGDLGDDYF